MTGVAQAANVICHGIKDHAWSEVELAEFERELERINIPARLAGGLRMERASWLETIMPLMEKKGMSLLAGMAAPDEKNENWGYKEAFARPAFWFYCKYWMPGDKIFYAQSIQQWVAALDQVPNEGMQEDLFPDFAKEYCDENPAGWGTFRRLVSMLSLPSLTGTFRKAAKYQTEVSQTRVAIALERYRMKYGGYPEKLDALVPEFLAKLPLDLVTMEPFLYRREATGKFTLWSVGWDEIDDEATPGKKDDEGDWVWGVVPGAASPPKGAKEEKGTINGH